MANISSVTDENDARHEIVCACKNTRTNHTAWLSTKFNRSRHYKQKRKKRGCHIYCFMHVFAEYYRVWNVLNLPCEHHCLFIWSITGSPAVLSTIIVRGFMAR